MRPDHADTTAPTSTPAFRPALISAISTLAALALAAASGCASDASSARGQARSIRATGSAGLLASPAHTAVTANSTIAARQATTPPPRKQLTVIPLPTTPPREHLFRNGKRNAYRQVNLVANKPEFNPQILDPLLANGWGIAIRPPGAGGHFWISNAASGTTTTYVGDVAGTPLFQDELKVVPIPSSKLYAHLPETVSQPTGQVYTGRSKTDFMVSGEGITAASKFIFVNLDGNVCAWTTGQTTAVTVYDNSENGAMYAGCAVTEAESGNRLYLCDFNNERVEVLDHEWKPIKVAGDFRDPRTPPYYAPYNLQYWDGRLYAALAHVGDDPGEEDQYPGYGYIAAFDLEGRLIQQFEHVLELNAPWGLTVAPDNFGAFSGCLLVGNFGDGRILAFDRTTGAYIDLIRDESGNPIELDGLWGMLFGNGVTLGESNHMYFAAGPNEEEDGLFGKLVPLEP